MSRRNERIAVVVASTTAVLTLTSGCSQSPGDPVLPGVDVVGSYSASGPTQPPAVVTVTRPPPSGTVPPTASASPGAAGEAPLDQTSAPTRGLTDPTSTPPPGPTGDASAPTSSADAPAVGEEPAPSTPPLRGEGLGPRTVTPAHGTHSPVPTPVATPGRAQPVAAAAPQPQPLEVSPQRTVPAEDLVQEVFRIPDADAVAAAGGALWVKREGGVDRIDPATNEIVASLRPATTAEPCAGLGGAGTVLWVCVGDGTVVRIDTATNAEVARLELGVLPGQHDIPMTFEHAWFLTHGGTRLTGVSHHTNTVARVVRLPGACTSVDSTQTGLWLACPQDGVALRVDPHEQAVTTTVEGLPGAHAVAAAGSVWVGYDGGTARIDPVTGQVTGAVDVGPDGSRGSLHAAGNHVFIRTEDTFLRILDATTLELIESVTTSQAGGGSALQAFGSLWATSGEDAALYRLDADG